MGDPFYAESKLKDVIYVLATSPGDVKQRLVQAFSPPPFITTSDFPSHLKHEWIWIHDQLFKRSNPAFDSKVSASLYRRHKKTAAKIAERVYDLWIQLHWYCFEDVRRIDDEDSE